MLPTEFPRGKTAMLFDIDGTLMDSVSMCVAGLGDAYEEYLGQRPPDDEIAALMGMPLIDQMNLYGLSERAEPVGERVQYTLGRYVAHEEKYLPFSAAFEAFSLLMERGYRLALVTSKNRVEVEDLFQRFPVLASVHAWVCSEDVPRPKPAPDSALLACQRLSVSPEDAILIGDSIYDLQCAFSAGVDAIGVTYGAAPTAVLEQHPAQMLLHTPEALRDWLDREFQPLTCDART